MTASIETYSGRYFDFRRPKAADVDISDVAVALSNTVRFGGHVNRFYSVAEHAVLVSRLVLPQFAYAALHHDDHEAYLGDIPSPLKRLLGRKYRRLARRVDFAICDAFMIDASFLHAPEVRAADALALRIEAAALKPSKGLGPHWGQTELPITVDIRGLEPIRAESAFMARHWELAP